MTDITRTEMEARFAASDARRDAYEARTDARFDNLIGTVERLTTEVRDFKTEVRDIRAEVRADGKNTRATIMITLIASLLAFAGAMWTAQANLLAAFQAGLAKQQASIIAAPPSPERKASLADAR